MTLGTSVKPYATQYVLLALVWVAGFAAGILLFVAFVQSWDNTALAFRPDLAALAPPVGAALACVAVAVIFGMAARAAGRLDTLRQRAAGGDVPCSWLAEDQPQPRVDTAAEPLMIVMRPRLWLGIASGLYLVYCGVLQTHLSAFDANGNLGLVLFLIPILSYIGLIAVIASYSAGYLSTWHIEASASAMIRTRGSADTTVEAPWTKARLFAIVHRDRRGRPDAFELATPTDIVRWRWVRRDARFWRVYNPELPWLEYEQQMRALHSMIAAKTGLPLYDLSGGERELTPVGGGQMSART